MFGNNKEVCGNVDLDKFIFLCIFNSFRKSFMLWCGGFDGKLFVL